MMGQVLSFPPAIREQPRIVFGRALIRRLADLSAELTGIPIDIFLSPARSRKVAYARFAVMLVASENGKSSAQIGHVLDRHHTVVLDGIHRATQLEAEDPDFAELVRLLREEAAR